MISRGIARPLDPSRPCNRNPWISPLPTRFAALGVDRLLVYPLPLEDADDLARFL
jgi:hypothetical protein